MEKEKTKFCKHPDSCGQNILSGFIKSTKWTFILKFGISKVIQLVRRKNITLEGMFGFKTNKDTFRFAIIVGLINATYKLVLCAIRRISAKCPDKFAAPIAGIAAGLWLGADIKSRRYIFTTILLSRTCDTILNLLLQNAYSSE